MQINFPPFEGLSKKNNSFFNTSEEFWCKSEEPNLSPLKKQQFSLPKDVAVQMLLLLFPTLFLTSMAEAEQGSAGKSSRTFVWQDEPWDSSSSCANQNLKLLVLHQYITNKIIFTYQVHWKGQIILYWQKPIYENLILLCQENPLNKGSKPSKLFRIKARTRTIFESWHYFFSFW